MAENNHLAAIFQDVRVLYADALEELEYGKLRDSAEKAWGATKRATDALILARTGELPEFTSNTSQELVRLANQLDGGENLVSRYYVQIGRLHGDCFYKGLCDPIEDTERRIMETIDYIQDAERLAFP